MPTITRNSNSKSKKKTRSFFRPVHLHAILFLVIYTIISKAVFIKAIVSPNITVVFLVPYIFGVVAGVIFLYLLNHEDFFQFMKDVEKEERGKENTYLKKYLHYGKVLSALIIGVVGGPVFAAITIRFLLNKLWYKYVILAVGNIGSTLIFVSLTRGALSFAGF